MKYALIVGNSRYQDATLAKLKTPDADSRALAEVLGDKGIGGFDEVRTVTNQVRQDTQVAIENFLKEKKTDDLVLLYFSGHGVLDNRGELHFAMIDTQVNTLHSTAVPASFVTDRMDDCNSRRQILILDCCHSGAFVRGIRKGAEQPTITEATFEGRGGRGRVVLTSSAAMQFAWEGDQIIGETNLSLFTHYLLDGLKTGQADLDQDGRITLEEWYEYAYDKVKSGTPNQIPQRYSYGEGELVIADNPFLMKAAAGLPADLLQALESPYAEIREAAVNTLEKWLHVPDTGLAEQARNLLTATLQDDSRKVAQAAQRVLSGIAPKKVAALPPTSRPVDAVVAKKAEPQPAKPQPAEPQQGKPKPDPKREEFKQLVRSFDSEALLFCPLCGGTIKAKNLLKHIDGNHADAGTYPKSLEPAAGDKAASDRRPVLKKAAVSTEPAKPVKVAAGTAKTKSAQKTPLSGSVKKAGGQKDVQEILSALKGVGTQTPICGYCNKSITALFGHYLCTNCHKYFHSECTDVSTKYVKQSPVLGIFTRDPLPMPEHKCKLCKSPVRFVLPSRLLHSGY